MALDTLPASARRALPGIPGTRIEKMTPETGDIDQSVFTSIGGFDGPFVGLTPIPRPTANAKRSDMPHMIERGDLRRTSKFTCGEELFVLTVMLLDRESF